MTGQYTDAMRWSRGLRQFTGSNEIRLIEVGPSNNVGDVRVTVLVVGFDEAVRTALFLYAPRWDV